MECGLQKGLRQVGRTAMALAVALSAVSGAHAATEEERLKATFKSLESGSLSPPEARAECLLNLSTAEMGEPLRQVATGFFQESRSKALAVLCEALVQALVKDQLSSETIDQAIEGGDVRSQSLAMGRLIRAAYFAHREGLDPATSGAPGP